MRNKLPLTLAALTLLVLIGGTNFVAVRFSNLELAPFWGAGSRFAVASFILFIVVYFKKLRLPKGQALLGTILYGILGFGASYAFIYIALLQVSAGLAAVIMSLVPLFTMFLAFFQGLEKISFRVIIGGLIAAGGIAILFNNQLTINSSSLYLLVMLGAAAVAAETGVVVKKFPKSHPLVANAIGMGTGAAILLILALVSKESLMLPTLPSTWIALVYLIFIGSIIMFMLYLYVLSRWTASATSYTFVLFPIVATLAAAWLEKVPASFIFLVSSALVLAGVYIGVLAPLKGREKRT